jgi:hypothetical protein
LAADIATKIKINRVTSENRLEFFRDKEETYTVTFHWSIPLLGLVPIGAEIISVDVTYAVHATSTDRIYLELYNFTSEIEQPTGGGGTAWNDAGGGAGVFNTITIDDNNASWPGNGMIVTERSDPMLWISTRISTGASDFTGQLRSVTVSYRY